MPVTEILLLRHGHRLSWILDPTTGKYSSSHPYPTRLPADPPLASHGVLQAQETGSFLLLKLGELAKQDRLRIYSSLFYRCLETLQPAVEKLRNEVSTLDHSDKLLKGLEVRGERGLGEWFGRAWFEQPAPAQPGKLRQNFYPWLDENYESRIIPNRYGERIYELHDRVAAALERVTADVDNEFKAAGKGDVNVTILICGHAAQIICAGRFLTGNMPEDPDEEDFKCFTCGISKFVRRMDQGQQEVKSTQIADQVGGAKWRNGYGLAGGWDCVKNSNCEHLSQGEERGWHFHGDESFDSYGPLLEPITSTGASQSANGRTDEVIERSSKL